jgi:hypothetical protein
MASSYGKLFFEMYFNEWGGRWDTPVRIHQTIMASGIEYALSGFDLGGEYKNKRFQLSTVVLTQSVSIEKFISNFNESKNMVAGFKSGSFVRWLFSTDKPKEKNGRVSAGHIV